MIDREPGKENEARTRDNAVSGGVLTPLRCPMIRGPHSYPTVYRANAVAMFHTLFFRVAPLLSKMDARLEK
jgi:hypothetical protein